MGWGRRARPHEPSGSSRSELKSNQHTFRVIYGDTDMMGIVYYANYLRYFEAGRSELMRALDIPYRAFEEKGFAMPVVEASVRYRAPATYDDLLTLDTRIKQVRRSSIRIDYELVRDVDSVLIATGETRHACLGPDGRLARFPSDILETLDGS